MNRHALVIRLRNRIARVNFEKQKHQVSGMTKDVRFWRIARFNTWECSRSNQNKPGKSKTLRLVTRSGFVTHYHQLSLTLRFKAINDSRQKKSRSISNSNERKLPKPQELPWNQLGKLSLCVRKRWFLIEVRSKYRKKKVELKDLPRWFCLSSFVYLLFFFRCTLQSPLNTHFWHAQCVT